MLDTQEEKGRGGVPVTIWKNWEYRDQARRFARYYSRIDLYFVCSALYHYCTDFLDLWICLLAGRTLKRLVKTINHYIVRFNSFLFHISFLKSSIANSKPYIRKKKSNEITLEARSSIFRDYTQRYFHFLK